MLRSFSAEQQKKLQAKRTYILNEKIVHVVIRFPHEIIFRTVFTLAIIRAYAILRLQSSSSTN